MNDALFDFDFQVESQTFTIEGHPKGHFASVKSRLIKTRASISIIGKIETRDLTKGKKNVLDDLSNRLADCKISSMYNVGTGNVHVII